MELKPTEKTKKQQCISKTQKGKRCSRSASVGDKCKTHAKGDTKNNQVRANICGIVYHNHQPGIKLKNCEACLLKKKKTIDSKETNDNTS